MTDDDKALVERLAAEADNFKVAREVYMRGMLYRAADRIEALSAENERLRKEHEAFRQEVSDAVSMCRTSIGLNTELDRFIIPKPDPLVIEAREICARVCEGWIDIPKDRAAAYRAGAHDDEADFAYAYAALAKRDPLEKLLQSIAITLDANDLREALDEAGLEIREKSNG